MIELIVVIGIIALLSTLSAAAVMRVQQAQRESNTDKYLRAAAIGLDQQTKAARDRIAAERPDDIIILMTSNANCGNDMARAKALHMMLRLRQEFPQTYAEVRYTFSGQFQSPCGTVNLANLNAKYGPKDLYLRAIASAPGGGSPYEEAAALLPIVLGTSRGGAAFNILEAGPTGSITVGGKEMKVLVDAWGTPISFRRCAVDAEMAANNNMIANELNSEPFVSKTATMTGYRDPVDPEGKLTANVWTGANALPGARAIAASWFTVPLNNEIANPFDGFNRGPYLRSAGRDSAGKYTPGQLTVFDAPTPDDLLSFRIAGIGKGN